VSGDYFVKWASKRKKEDKAAQPLSKDTILHLGNKQKRFRDMRSEVGKVHEHLASHLHPTNPTCDIMLYVIRLKKQQHVPSH
jgi:hypothetical protein